MKSLRILAAIAAGDATVADLEVAIDFTLSRHGIAAHVQNLKASGKIERFNADVRAGARGTAHFYRLTPHGRAFLDRHRDRLQSRAHEDPAAESRRRSGDGLADGRRGRRQPLSQLPEG